MKPSGVYRIFCTANGKSYIGSSVNVAKRIRDHKNSLTRGAHCNSHLQRTWNKYGWRTFEFRVLEICDVSVLRQREKEIIDRVRPEFNCCGIDPGRSLTSPNQETREKLSAAQIGNKNGVGQKNHLGHTHSAEARAKMSAALRGKPRRPLSQETRAKIRAANLGRHPSDETRAKLRAAHARAKRHYSDEARAKISKTHLGKPGHPCSDETREKLSRALSGRPGHPCSPETRAKISRANRERSRK